jgi:hypothetical protein
MKDYTCYVISNKPELFNEIKQDIAPEELHYFDGTGYTSFSKLVNDCVANCPTEIVIIMSDKVRPTKENVNRAVELIKQGHGLVALYRFAFFGFKKELFRKIGMMDERYIGGGYEDDDYYIRLKEANISMHVTEEVFYKRSFSSWNYSKSKIHFTSKWMDTTHPEWHADAKRSPAFVKRALDEMPYSEMYDLGPSVPATFLNWDKSFIQPSKARGWVLSKGQK